MLDQFFFWGELPAGRIIGSYDTGLVILSFIIATLASYVALDMASQQGRAQPRKEALFWHIGGSIAMGAGIWSMHFTGMLAYNMGMEHNYHLGITLLSLAIPIIFSYIVLHIVKTREFTLATIWLAAPFLGIGIAAMHYTGMEAMEMAAGILYRPVPFAISIIVAILASAAALALSFKSTKSKPGSRLSFKLLSASVMGAAICGMHYIGMYAAVIIPRAGCRFDATLDGSNDMLAFGVGSVTLIILGIAIAALTINQKFLESLKAQVSKQTEELRQINEALRYAKDIAETASISKSEFLANMSHEIRTPMNAVVGIAHILQSDRLTPEKRKECLDTLTVSAESLLALINDLLDISKIETNNVELEHIDFNLQDIVEEVIKILSLRAQEKGISLSFDYASKQSRFLGDPLRIRQVVVNLVSNAVKFTENGGVTVTVESKEIEQNGNCEVKVKVVDTGIGISKDKIDAIFDKFIQAESSTTRKYGGSGLGLAICKGLAEKMGGRIEVESKQGKGSAFTLFLNLNTNFSNKVETKRGKSPLRSAKSIKSSRVLLVEDNPGNVLVTTTYLEGSKIGFDIAKTGVQALEMFNSQNYDLILMDIQMPDMNGYEIAKRIRATETNNKAHPIPIIAMTAFASVESRDKCLDAGMDDYIAKPFKPHEFEDKIYALLERKT